MRKYFNKYVNVGITDDLSLNESTQVRMVNFGTLFVTFAGISFFIESLNIGNAALSAALIIFPVFFLLVPLMHSINKRVAARNILFFGLCFEILVFSLIDNPSSFSINYFFGIAMLSFVVYNKPMNRILGLVLCIFLYFSIDFIRPYFQHQLPFNRNIYVMDVLTLFIGILLCLNYFQRITKNQLDIIINQKIELEKINVNKNKLISIITHDIRNPINNLNQVLKLDEHKNLSTEELNYILDNIRKEFIVQFESIENLLKWSQNQLTEINAKFERVEVDQLIMNLIKELNYSITQKNIQLGIRISGVDSINIDKTHLIIILRNILNNSIKFTKEFGTIDIITSREDKKYFIDIVDNGIGFPNGISNVFAEVEISTQQIGTSSEKGNGLGLIICKELASKNNAQLLYKNNEYGGSTLRLQIDTM
jgi:two-component system sensor histidine kinase/response regulator